MGELLNGIPWYAEGPWQRQVNDYLGAGGITAGQLGANLRTGIIHLPLSAARIILSNDFADETVVNTGGTEKASGGILALDGAIFSINRVNGATDKGARLIGKANTTGELQWDSIAIPPDMDTEQDMIVKMWTAMAGATNTPVISVGVWFGVGGSNVGGDTAALSNTAGLRTVTVAHAGIPAQPNFFNLTLIPGAHANDAWWLYALWIEYQKRS